MPFTNEKLAELINTLDTMQEQVATWFAAQTASTPIAYALDEAAFQIALTRNILIDAIKQMPRALPQEVRP